MNRVFLLFICLALLSCENNEFEEYRENDTLFRISEVEKSLRIDTPVALELNGYCMIKKNKTWMLINSKATKKIKVMNDQEVTCLSKKELDWLKLICPNSKKEFIENAGC